MRLNAIAAAVASAALLAGCGGDGASTPSTESASAPSPKFLAQVATSNGITTATFSGKRANYTITKTATGYTITDNVGSEGTNTYTILTRINFADVSIALDIDGTAGKMYRLYQAAFDRQPDLSGIGYWIGSVETSGSTMTQVSQGFISSSEFSGKYGSLNTTQFVTQLYANVLHRSPDSGGLAFHVGNLDSGRLSQAQVLIEFSESPENQAQVLSAIQSGIQYTPYVAPGTATAPGIPAIGSATAGNAAASIAFSAPASNGGATISTYTVTCTGGGKSVTGSGASSPITVSGLTNGTAYSCTVTATSSAGTSTASSAVSVTPVATNGTTSHLFCPHSASVFNSGLSLTSTVSITCSTTQRTMTANGIPDHVTGTFPNSGNPTAIKAVTVNFAATLNPVASSTTSTAVAHVIGYANNGVKFDPATAESYQNAGVWKIEALNQTYFPFGTDSSNAHVQPDGAYHYHGMPEGYVNLLGKGTAMTLVGFALDGFPIYARYGYSTATSASSTVRAMTPSYRLKTTASSGRPSTSIVPMGTFTQDYEYVAGLGDLDECNGRFGVTPEFPSGIYHYYVTDGYPYIQRCIKGTALVP